MVKHTICLTAGTDVGLVRNNNEDNFIVCPELGKDEWFVPENVNMPIVLGPNGSLLVVADGMGGLNAGEVASAIAVDTVRKYFSEADFSLIKSDDKSIEKFLKNVITEADYCIKQHVKENPDTKGMGTTLILVWILESGAHLAWCGDSRAYIFNKVSGLIRFSKDHSYVQELVDKGILDEELAFDHPDSNIITRCLGDFPEKARPDYKSYYLQNGDYILLCSDGLCGYCRDNEIQEIMIAHQEDVNICKNQLISAALGAGGYDNVTVALLHFSVVETDEKSKSDEEPAITISDTVESVVKTGGKKTFFFCLIIVIMFALLVAAYFYKEQLFSFCSS